MYAVFIAGGKQYKAKVGDVLEIEKLEQDPQDLVEFDKVLLTEKGDDIKIGIPYLDGVKVIAEVVEQKRGDKINIIKFRRRKHHLKKMGHRQYLTKIKITDIKEV